MACPFHANAGMILRVCYSITPQMRGLFGIRRKPHPMCGVEYHTTIEEVFINFLKLILKIIHSGSVWTGTGLYGNGLDL